MILALVGRGHGPEPRWFSDLGLRSIGTLGSGSVHFGLRGNASSHSSGGLSVVADAPSRIDAAHIAGAYRQHGSGCVQLLRGRFRFLLHDARSGRVFAASSSGPPWPLAYWSSSGTTVISSSVLAMLRCPEVPRGLDDSYVMHQVMGLSAMRDGATAIQGIRRLCPGEAIAVEPSGARVTMIDRLTPRDVSESRGRLHEVYLAELGAAVVACIGGGRCFVSLSGGLDSAALVSAALLRREELPALSFVATTLDPTAEIDAIAAMERAWPHVSVTRLDASKASDLSVAGELRDDPPLTPMALLPARALLWSRAREEGFQTALEGEGGDELFAMLVTPLDALREGRLGAVAREVLASAGRRALVEYGLWLPLLPRGVQREWLARRTPADAHLPAFAAWDSGQHPQVREATHEYLATLVHRPFPERVREWLSAPSVIGAGLSRRHIAASFGVDLEWPMLERDVLELVLGLHAAGAIKGDDKGFLRETVRGMVPDVVRLQPKDVGLYKAFISRVLTSPGARNALRDAPVRRRLADIVRFDRIEAMLDGLAAGRFLGASALWQLECVISFAEWYGRASREYGVD